MTDCQSCFQGARSQHIRRGFCDYVQDSTCGISNDAARDTAALVGKVLRITKDGGIPPTNPFQGPDGVRCNVTGRTTIPQQCREIYALGFRNPFRLAFDPNVAGTRLYINDVGQDLMEEVNLGAPGLNYGWNIREGHCWAGTTAECSGAAPAPSLTSHSTSPINCTGTSATDVGSTCSASTTADALYPAVARELSRAVWQLSGLDVYDAGPNGSGFGSGCPPTCGDGDERVYLRQGLFAP